jgi:hypothetical protein
MNINGCWYCGTDDESLVFCSEFDCWVHIDCLHEARKDENDMEAKIMARELFA